MVNYLKQKLRHHGKQPVFDNSIGLTWDTSIPDKLFHQAALLGDNLKDAKDYGWQHLYRKQASRKTAAKVHSWDIMAKNIEDHINQINLMKRDELRHEKIPYFKRSKLFTDQNTIQSKKKGLSRNVTAENFVIAVGREKKCPDIPGSKLGITVDELLTLPQNPGKTLLVGATNISLECAGFLAGIGLDVAVMVRSVLLRGFDQQIAEKIGIYMQDLGIKFIRSCIPIKLESQSPEKIKVYGKYEDGTE